MNYICIYGIPCLPEFSFPSTSEPSHEYILKVGKHHVTTGINQHKYYTEPNTEFGDATGINQHKYYTEPNTEFGDAGERLK